MSPAWSNGIEGGGTRKHAPNLALDSPKQPPMTLAAVQSPAGRVMSPQNKDGTPPSFLRPFLDETGKAEMPAAQPQWGAGDDSLPPTPANMPTTLRQVEEPASPQRRGGGGGGGVVSADNSPVRAPLLSPQTPSNIPTKLSDLMGFGSSGDMPTTPTSPAPPSGSSNSRPGTGGPKASPTLWSVTNASDQKKTIRDLLEFYARSPH